MKRTAVRALTLGLLLFVLIAPVATFFNNRGGFSILTAGSAQATLQTIFPLFGLIAFTLLTAQILLATNRWWLDAYWPGAKNYHRYEGMFTLAFALLHPFSILLGFGLSSYWHHSFVSDKLALWLIPAYLGLSILVATVTTAILSWKFDKTKWWFKLHLFNYGVFVLIWLHSWFIGSDVRFSNLRWLWLIYLVAVLGSFVKRRTHQQKLKVQHAKASLTA